MRLKLKRIHLIKISSKTLNNSNRNNKFKRKKNKILNYQKRNKTSLKKNKKSINKKYKVNNILASFANNQDSVDLGKKDSANNVKELEN